MFTPIHYLPMNESKTPESVVELPPLEVSIFLNKVFGLMLGIRFVINTSVRDFHIFLYNIKYVKLTSLVIFKVFFVSY